ncbi:MAG TPA: hypothetical protein VK797_13115 [Tepidisphaeraceae bacterium]|jgi:hypothetical protein|nr:hypothetical protein [Tepidisphaeraceae bacterium]
MTVQTVKLAGRKFVIVTEKEFQRLRERAEEVGVQDRGDAAESRRRMKERGGRTLAEVRKRIGA